MSFIDKYGQIHRNRTEAVVETATVHPAVGFGSQAKVMAVMDDSSDEVEIFSFFDDELSFTAEEFVGMTVGEARALFHKKDVAYLQS